MLNHPIDEKIAQLERAKKEGIDTQAEINELTVYKADIGKALDTLVDIAMDLKVDFNTEVNISVHIKKLRTALSAIELTK